MVKDMKREQSLPLAQLRGSGSIAQLSDMVLGLERDSQSDDIATRNTTCLRVLKNRFVGMTGPCYIFILRQRYW